MAPRPRKLLYRESQTDWHTVHMWWGGFLPFSAIIIVFRGNELPYNGRDLLCPNSTRQSVNKCYYPTFARELHGSRVWGKFVFRTLEPTDTPTNLVNQVKVGHDLDQSRSIRSRGLERAHQNNEQPWRSSRTDRRLSRQFWGDWLSVFTFLSVGCKKKPFWMAPLTLIFIRPLELRTNSA